MKFLPSLEYKNIIEYKEEFFDDTSKTLKILMRYIYPKNKK